MDFASASSVIDFLPAFIAVMIVVIPVFMTIKLVSDHKLMKNGEKVDATITDYRQVFHDDRNGSRRVEYRIHATYNYMGTEYQSVLRMSRSAMSRFYPELTGSDHLPDLSTLGIRGFIDAITAPLKETVTSEIEEVSALEGTVRIPLSISRYEPKRAVIDMDKLEALRGTQS